ncbi:hypothetical protein HAX54_027948 [Datura stramonium]|uniref:Uncharacterized protein n=1 Tax=Datura stramonium TaxID=4076 RepID=A0ABS8V5X1_DATST|nr:hypothetical protein [Datura stramonium]
MERKQNQLLPYEFFLIEVFEKFGVPIPAFEPYSNYDAIDYYEIGGHHNDVFAEYDIVVEGRTISFFPLLLLLILHWSGIMSYYALKKRIFTLRLRGMKKLLLPDTLFWLFLSRDSLSQLTL